MLPLLIIGVFKQPLSGDFLSLLLKTQFADSRTGLYTPNPINPQYLIKHRGTSTPPDTPSNPILRDPKQLRVTDSWHAYQQERILHNMKEEYCAVLDIHSDIQYPHFYILVNSVMHDQQNFSSYLMDQVQLTLSSDIKQQRPSSGLIHRRWISPLLYLYPT